ncbi:GGDEF domain-containing protein [Pararhizobium sp. O133]|uniref:GGDEF domain-containing protein n=1 Tax=Pararhizobium sp. O133 TaxID=3449278 RepID=UPI003F684114
MSFLSAIAMISVMVMFPVLLSLRTTGVPGASKFCIACALAAAGAALGLTSDLAPIWVHTVASTVLNVAAGLVILAGFREFLGRASMHVWSLVTVLAGTAAALTFFSYAVDNATARICLGAGLAGLIYTLVGLTIMRHWPRERAIMPYLLVCCLAAFAVAGIHAMRVVVFSAGLPAFGGVAPPQFWIATLMNARQLIMPLFFLGVILMLHGWMIANLRHMVAHDDLTGTLSRRAFMTRAERMFSTAAGDQPIFMLLDLDRFKQINDQYGHAGGDAALAHFSRTVRETLGGRGILGRLGGEEFGIALTGIDRLAAIEIAKAICAGVRAIRINDINGAEIALTVSIGLATGEPGGTVTDAMIRADGALYEAKAAGRDRLSVSESLYSSASSRALAGAAAQMRAAAAVSTTPLQFPNTA